MNYYPFHLGDYMAHTAHLEPMEDLAYRRLLDLYYLRETPIPESPADAARLIRLKDQVDAVETVLNEFFVMAEDGWRNDRCDDEIERMQDKQAKARASAQASVAARQAKKEQPLNGRSATAKQTRSGGETEAELPTPTPTPTPKIHTPSLRSGVLATKAVKPTDVPDDVWREFQTIRKAKRAPLTPKALQGIEREAGKAGITTAQALTICIERGWQGFQAAWHRERGKAESFAGKDYGAGGDL